MPHEHKKNLGQNWLIDQTVVADMVNSSQTGPDATVIEIGPGEGFLTTSLLATGAQVLAIEKDHDLINSLQTKFAREVSVGKFQLIQSDIRDLAINANLVKSPYVVVANIPYYITGLIIRKFLTADLQPQSMTLLVQREVADRIVAVDHKQSVLSLSVAVYGQARKIRNVKAGAFRPIPTVDSAVITITNINRDWFRDHKIDETRFFTVIKQAFNQKRKTLGATLNLVRSHPLAGLRPEDISLDQWPVIIAELSDWSLR